jgi:endo-1,4-beta-D-glucanase Y/4-amino-4-deoxy-L-arabinose transferase-like glycosyltransferase
MVRARTRWTAAVTSARPVLEATVLLAVLAVAAGFTGHNLFHHPQYELDEGTYVSSAWTMVAKGRLFYYTYTYAHPPLGWFQIGVWSVLTGGFDRFGMSINSGRVFMLVITVLSTLVIFAIVRRATGRVSAAALAGVAFAISPLAIGFHRQVYLDNIGMLWLLVSLYLLQSAEGRLGRIILSAVAFGITFLTKEVFVAMLPGMVLMVLVLTDRLQRRFAVALWTTTAVSFISLFVLLAVLKDELLPPGTLWSSSRPHVSLIQTYFRQAGREGGGLLDRHGEFWSRASQWQNSDPLFIGVGLAALGIGLLLWRWDRFAFGVSILTGCFVLFLGRGGVVLYYYVIPILALMALQIGLVAGHAINVLARWRPLRPAVGPALLAATIVLAQGAVARNDAAFNTDSTTGQHDAAEWVVRNLPHSALLIMDSYAWQDLHSDSFTHGQPFANANYYWPTFSDPVLKKRLLDDNWQKIDYLLISSNTLADAKLDPNLEMLQEAIDRSDTIRTFKSGRWSQWINRVRKLRRVQASQDPMLVNTWRSFVNHFVNHGRVVDPKTGSTTSQAQAAVMMQALYVGDRAHFDTVWEWTKQNLQVRGDALLASAWGAREDGTNGVLDGDATTSGDEDAALALLLAARRWGDSTYQDEAMAMLDSIWNYETVELGGNRFVVAGSWAIGDGVRGFDGPVIAPSALAPYAYRIFAEADPSRPWLRLVDSSYVVLSRIRATPNAGGEVGVVPTFLKLDPVNGSPRLVGDRIPRANEFSIDASRILTRLTIDYLWSKDDRARVAITAMSLPRQRLKSLDGSMGKLAIAYGLDGSTTVDGESMAMYANVIPSLLVTDDANLDFAHRAFAEKILSLYTEQADGTFWGSDPDDFDAQITAWFTCAVMDGSIANLWAGNSTIEWDKVLKQAQ